MLLTIARTRKHFECIENLYEETFPFEEKKPFDMIMKYNGKTFELIAVETEENGEFLALVILLKYKDLLLIDYFATTKINRNKGLGTKILKMLLEKYKDKKIFLEIESTEIASDNIEERIKRKNFYLKNGFKKEDFYIDLFGIEMEILSYNCKILVEEYFDLYLNQFNGRMQDIIKENVKLVNKK